MKGKKVLDMGCGFGLLLKKFQDAGAGCFGTDISGIAVAKCRERFPGLHVEAADCTQKPFSERFSLVTAFGLLGVVGREKHAQFIMNAAESLESGGILFATAPNAARPRLMDLVSGRGRLVSYEKNARTVNEWDMLLSKADFEEHCVFTVLRLPKSEKVFGRNIFFKAGGSGDPIVIFARKRARKQS
jgi:cyclopropane fatty-acyl-phospholipid synthase-like methyltransferase